MNTTLYKIYISNLPETATKNDLYSLFSPISSILSIDIFYDNITHKSLCYGYIIISSDPDIIFSRSFYLKGNTLSLTELSDRTQMKRSKYNHIKQSRKIFVGGLPPETTKLSLSRFFEKYGEVEYSIVMTDKHTNRPRGFGFVIFKNLFSVESALNDSWNHFINGKWVECKKANSKEECKEGRVESEGETNESSNDSSLSSDIISTSMPFTQKSKPLDNFVYVNSIDENNKYVQKQMEDYYRFKFSF